MDINPITWAQQRDKSLIHAEFIIRRDHCRDLHKSILSIKPFVESLTGSSILYHIHTEGYYLKDNHITDSYFWSDLGIETKEEKENALWE